MAKIQTFKGYEGDPPVPKPAETVRPNIVTVQDGVPVKYPGCEGIGVRVVHPANPKAPAKNWGWSCSMFPRTLCSSRAATTRRSATSFLEGRNHDTGGRKGSSQGGNVHSFALVV
jgi:hypothetical protein